MSVEWDAIIVGGGPAGSTLGYELSKAGFKTLILDKAKFPRYKTCGGIVDVKAAKRLDFDISPVVEDTISQVMISRNMERPFLRDAGRPITYNVSRERFDHFLLEKAIEAGCIVRQGDTVKTVEIGEDAVLVNTKTQTYVGRIAVGADGANSVVARAVGLRQNPVVIIGLEWEVAVEPADLAEWRGKVLLDLGTIANGYAWIFPKLDHLSIGAGGLQTDAKQVRAYYQAFKDKWTPTLTNPHTLREKGHRLPVLRKDDKVFKERVLLVGDAAGLIDPLSGEGIYYAIKSAQLAAQALQDYFRKPKTTSLARYQSLVENEIIAELQRSKAYLRLYGLSPRMFISGLKRSDRLWQAACKLLTGEIKYTDIGRRLGPARVILDRLDW